ncbi:DUF4214 domain-containing protein [Candidatus Riflebacteria bacterium]
MKKLSFRLNFSVLISFLLLFIIFSIPTLNGSDNKQKLKNLYNRHLGRDPDPSGINTYIGGVEKGEMSWDDVQRAILSSPEYKERKAKGRGEKIGRGGSDYGKLKALYNELLGRDPDPSGIGTYLGAIKDGRMSWDEIRKSILASPEYRSRKKKSGSDGGHSTLAEVFSGVPGLDDSSSNSGSSGASNSGSEVEHNEKAKGSAGTFSLNGSTSGWLSFETRGIMHQDKKCANGDWEYIFLTMRGDGFRRILLLHAGGRGRAIRAVNQPHGSMQMEIASDNLPDWHEWRVEWLPGQIKYFLDGRQIGRTEKFNGKPTRCIVGGNENSRRNFLGEWRNFRTGSN